MLTGTILERVVMKSLLKQAMQVLVLHAESLAFQVHFDLIKIKFTMFSPGFEFAIVLLNSLEYKYETNWNFDFGFDLQRTIECNRLQTSC